MPYQNSRLIDRRSVLAATALLAAAPAAAFAQADYPNRAIKFVVPVPPGNMLDSMPRIVGDKLSGAQLYALELTYALASKPEVRLRLLVDGHLDGEPKRLLNQLAEVELISRSEVKGGIPRSDIVHRPSSSCCVDVAVVECRMTLLSNRLDRSCHELSRRITRSEFISMIHTFAPYLDCRSARTAMSPSTPTSISRRTSRT